MHRLVCGRTDLPRYAEAAHGQSPAGEGESLLDGLGGAGDGLVVTKLHESLQSTGDPQHTKEQNPRRISLSLYRKFCQAK